MKSAEVIIPDELLDRLFKKMNCIKDKEFNFSSYFDQKSGFYIRTGIIDENGVDTGIDSFQASFPQLLDVGIMGSCSHGLTGLCAATGIKCYQSGSTISEPNMKLEDFKRIVDESEGKVFQFALGGRGDPELHENFFEIVEYSRKKGIIPNITTSGFLLDSNKVKVIKEYCGAAAVSWYRNEYTTRAISMLTEAGIKTNIHYVLGEDTIDEAIEILEDKKIPEGINKFIFLLFKPVGAGDSYKPLGYDSLKIKRLFKAIENVKNVKRVGFDSCTVPAVLNFTDNIDPNCFDSCEGGRYSAYITADMKIMPCSFDQKGKWIVDLRKNTIMEAWESNAFKDFREIQRKSCPECNKRELCYGGCPIKPEIVLCPDKKYLFKEGL